MISQFKKNVAKVLALGMVLALAAPAQAEYRYRFISGSNSLKVSFMGTEVGDEVPLSDSRYASMSAVRDKAYSTIRSEWDRFLRDQFQTQPEYDGHRSWMTGDLAISLNGGQAGSTANVRVSGLALGFHGDFSKWRYGFKVRCYLDVNLPGVSISGGQVDLNSGVIQGARLVTGTPQVSKGCSSALSWIPIIGDLADSKAMSEFNAKLEPIMQRAFSAGAGVNLRTLNFGGLDAALPPGKFIIAGRDAGMFVRNNLAYLIQTGVELQLKEDLQIPEVATQPFYRMSWSPLSIAFGDGTKVSAFVTYNLEQYWDPKCGQYTCQEP